MKIPNFKKKTSKFSLLENIHFRKIAFTFIMIFSMIFGNFDTVQASGTLYNYDVFNTKDQYSYTSERAYGDEVRPVPNIKHSSFTFNTNTGLFDGAGDEKRQEYGYWASEDKKILFRAYRGNAQCDGEDGPCFYHTFYSKYTTTSKKVKGGLIRTITGTSSQYPVDGIHSDGNWYVKKGIANTVPNLTITTPVENSYFGKDKTINLSGTLNDTDSSQNVTISATINGKTKSTTVATPSNNKPWTLSWSSNELADGTYKNIVVTANDGNGGTDSKTYAGSIIVDKTNPTAPTLNLDETWTSGNRTFTVTGGTDSGSGLDRLEYRIGTGPWTRYSSTVTALSTSGTVQVQARSIDKAGNISPVVTKTARVDKTSPSAPTLNLDENWISGNRTFTLSGGSDGHSGINRLEYRIGTGAWTTYSSTVTALSSSGTIEVQARTIDNVGNISLVVTKTAKVDKTGPIVNPPIVTAVGIDKINVIADASDQHSGLNGYLFNRNNEDITAWINDKFTDENLSPNKQYSYKYKAKDNVNNESSYSNLVSKYTLALDPIHVILRDITNTSIKLEVVNNGGNINTPETYIELVEVGSNRVINSNWSQDTNKELHGLSEGKEYEVYLKTRNGDNIENEKIKAPLVDENGNPIDKIGTVKMVDNYKVAETTTNTIKVTWDKIVDQEYKVYLKDSSGNIIKESEILSNNEYIFKDLQPNSNYIPHITTRKINASSFVGDIKVVNEDKAYTDAENVTRATFEPGDESIAITLNTEKSNNPSDTKYWIRNDITGQEQEIIHSDPIWINTNLARESFYTYSVKVINKNGKNSFYTRLIFEGENDPHTTIKDIEVDPETINPDMGDYVNLDELEDHGYDNPIWFDPITMDDKEYVKLEGEIYKITKDKRVEIENKEKIDVINYSYSKEGFGYTDWKNLSEGTFKEALIFNYPGIYNTHWKFKNYSIESKPVLINYFADWIEPTVKGTPSIKGQSAVTGDSFTVDVSIEDNVSPYLFYTIDDTNWFLLKDDTDTIVFDNISKSSSGTQNKLAVKVSDICGNVSEMFFTVWGISK